MGEGNIDLPETPPEAPVRSKPEVSEGHVCDYCWRRLRAGFFGNKGIEVSVIGRGMLHFCDQDCHRGYMDDGGSLYEAGARYGFYAGLSQGYKDGAESHEGSYALSLPNDPPRDNVVIGMLMLSNQELERENRELKEKLLVAEDKAARWEAVNEKLFGGQGQNQTIRPDPEKWSVGYYAGRHGPFDVSNRPYVVMPANEEASCGYAECETCAKLIGGQQKGPDASEETPDPKLR